LSVDARLELTRWMSVPQDLIFDSSQRRSFRSRNVVSTANTAYAIGLISTLDTTLPTPIMKDEIAMIHDQLIGNEIMHFY
jgi:hypothetical protein